MSHSKTNQNSKTDVTLNVNPDGTFSIGKNCHFSKYSLEKLTRGGIQLDLCTDTDTTEAEKMISRVGDVVDCMGYTALTPTGLDEFDKMSCHEDEAYSYPIEGGKVKGLDYPYNLIQIRPGNEWLIKCANIHFRVSNDIVPFTSHGVNVNASSVKFNRQINEKIYKVPRSSGIPCQAIMECGHGLKLSHGLNASSEKKLYISSSFMMDGSDLDLKKIYGLGYKIVKLEDIMKLNDDFGKIQIYFKSFTEEELSEASFGKRFVMNHFNTIHDKWLKDILIPAINRTNSKYCVEIYENDKLTITLEDQTE